ncbi:hypothetical protein BCR35DRAFT_333274 [Leucosporidium creatinivorum]|uniref:Uncharacterized protein n=1 Tax=Leucosporidium creatinivorum TaxID=106004 RepID=A0A1Y2ET45_9BASI|nr:hypothetical protein BCR35DRAFT_333274 [Leucosporidium creatinivorum]
MLFTSFTKFAVLASLASSAFALPAVRAEGEDLSLDKRHYKKKTCKVSTTLGTCKSSIIKRKTELSVKLGALSNPSAHAVSAIVVPCVNGIIADVRVATSALGAAKASIDIDLDIQATASLIAGIINAVLGCLSPVVKLLVKLPLLGALLLPVFATLNVVLCALLSIVSGLVPGVFGVLTETLGGVTATLKTIGLGGVCSLLSL